MRNDYDTLLEQSECNKALFSLIEAIIEKGDSIAVKHLFDSYKIKSMFEKVGLALRVIPPKSHKPIVVTDYSYVKEGAGLNRGQLVVLGRFLELRVRREVVLNPELRAGRTHPSVS